MASGTELILAHMIRARAEEMPERDVTTFVSIDDDGVFHDEVRTYQNLWDNAQRLSVMLKAKGMKPGESFGLVMQNHPEFVEAMIAASITNTVFVPIDARTRGEKLAYMLGFAECRGVIVADYATANLAAVRADLPDLEWVTVMMSGETGIEANGPSLADYLAKPVPDLPIEANDPFEPMQMLYTSGTTGDPKAILTPHGKYGGSAGFGYVLGLTKDDRPYTGLSLTHANAQIVTLASVLGMGMRGIISRKFTKSRFWDVCRAYGATTFNLLGGMTTGLYSEPRQPNDADNPVRMVCSAGMPAAIWQDFARRFDVEIFEFYGTAEGGMLMNPPGVGPVGSIGKPPPGSIARIVDEDDIECPPGVEGEIVFQNADGTSAPVIYFKDRQASGEKTTGNWFRSGDIGHTDEEGWFYFDYRRGGGIRHNGDFVNPGFVEKAVGSSEMISDVYVYGIEAASGAPGEKDVVAAVVLQSGVIFDAASLYKICRDGLEPNFVPSFIQVLDEIPKTASEKPQDRFLIEMFDVEAPNIYREH